MANKKDISAAIDHLETDANYALQKNFAVCDIYYLLCY